MRTGTLLLAILLSISGTLLSGSGAGIAATDSKATFYRFEKVEGLDIFYREAGPKNAPVVLLLHGFPTSSHMYRELIPRLAGKYRVIAPDYPGFGQSSMPDRKEFAYTFANLTNVIEKFTEQLGIQSYTLYVMDYGAPVGFRLALRNPRKVTALIVQNGNAYVEGIDAFWEPIKALWENPTAANRDALRKFLAIEATKWQYTHGVPNPALVSPDTWIVDQAGLDRPGNDEIQLDLFYDYRTNVDLYPQFHDYFRKFQPPALVIWGANDQIFVKAGAAPYKRDLKNVELHLVDTGHFLLETHVDEAAEWIDIFLAKHSGSLRR